MIGRCSALPMALLGIALVVTACGGRATSMPAAPNAGTGTATAGPTPVPNPGSPGASAGSSAGSGSGGGAGDDGNSGGTGGGTGGDPGGGVLDPAEPVFVVPAPNVRDIRDVGAATLDAAVEGRRVTARVTWWSGVEPCTALAGIAVDRGERDITITIREGSAARPDVMCTAQVIHKAAIVDLGELEPGSWTIRAGGEAPAVEVTVAG
jgi:hypothetical protein